MATRKPRKPYQGVILKPAPERDPDASNFGNAAQYLESAFLKLDALMKHYEIDRDDPEAKWMLLALKLASEYIPGFAPPPLKTPQGRRPTPGKRVDDIILFMEMRQAEIDGKSVANKARHLTKTHKRFKGKKPETLRERFYLLKNEKSPEGKRLRNFMAYIARDNLQEK